MTKTEFIKAIKPCKKCGTSRFMYYDLYVDENLNSAATIKCIKCCETVEDSDIPKVLATWNAKNYDNAKRYVIIIQHSTKLFDIKVLKFKIDSTAKLLEDVKKNYPDYNILSIKDYDTNQEVKL